VELASGVTECAHQAEAKGYTVERLDQCHMAARAAQALHDELTARWPWLTPGLAEKALADYQAGRCRPGQESLSVVPSGLAPHRHHLCMAKQ
jgi:hypothetical protein